jgi:hypothetical protein
VRGAGDFAQIDGALRNFTVTTKIAIQNIPGIRKLKGPAISKLENTNPTDPLSRVVELIETIGSRERLLRLSTQGLTHLAGLRRVGSREKLVL